jgi:hypothetical protein
MNLGPLGGKSLLHGDSMMAPFARREGIRTVSSGRSPDLRGPQGTGERLPASHDAVTRGSPYLAYRCGGSAGIESVGLSHRLPVSPGHRKGDASTRKPSQIKRLGPAQQ